jgi:hypothetical protein
VEAIAIEPSPTMQRRLFNEVEPRARAAGFADVVDDWEPDVRWLRGTDS